MNVNLNIVLEGEFGGLGGVFESRELAAGACVQAPALALITEGLAELAEARGPARARGSGEFIGLENFLLGGERGQPTLVRARTRLRWLELDARRLSTLGDDLRAQLDRVAVQELRGRQARDRAPVIAVIPGHRGAPVQELAERLTEQLAALDPSARLVRPEPLPDPAWRAWLDELRRDHRYVVLACDVPEQLDARGRWPTQLSCIVVDAARSPSSGIRCGQGLPRAGRSLLALVQSGARGPYSGSARWLARYPGVHAHHHLSLDARHSLARFARVLAGRATSLVLGAGGCRGFAHIGVYRALVEAGVELDFVAGSSIGAVIGGLIAHDWEPERLEHAARKIFLGGRSIFDLRPSPTSLLAGERLAQGFRAAYGEVEIEDLPLPFACTSTELISMQARVHVRGRLWQLSKASGSMPGAAPPVRVGEEVLVDGGVLDPLPLQLARQRHTGQVIAVNLISTHRSRRVADYFERPSVGAWLADRSQLHLVDVMRRSLKARAAQDIASKRRGDELWLSPPLEGVGVFDCARYEEIVERGYHYARERLRG